MTFDRLVSDTDYKFIARLQDAKARTEDFDRHQRASAGLETGDGSAHHALLNTPNAITSTRKKRKTEKTSNTALWLDLLENQIGDLQRHIESAERGFTAIYGEDWREQFAMRVLDPDLMPQRRDGESMEEYRARVEQALMDELLNDDGAIKDAYKDHPQYGKLAQWAQWTYDQQQARMLQSDLDDPNLSEADRTAKLEAFTQSASHERLAQALRDVSKDSAANATLETAKDDIEDVKGDVDTRALETSFLR